MDHGHLLVLLAHPRRPRPLVGDPPHHALHHARHLCAHHTGNCQFCVYESSTHCYRCLYTALYRCNHYGTLRIRRLHESALHLLSDPLHQLPRAHLYAVPFKHEEKPCLPLWSCRDDLTDRLCRRGCPALGVPPPRRTPLVHDLLHLCGHPVRLLPHPSADAGGCRTHTEKRNPRTRAAGVTERGEPRLPHGRVQPLPARRRHRKVLNACKYARLHLLIRNLRRGSLQDRQRHERASRRRPYPQADCRHRTRKD